MLFVLVGPSLKFNEKKNVTKIPVLGLFCLSKRERIIFVSDNKKKTKKGDDDFPRIVCVRVDHLNFDCFFFRYYSQFRDGHSLLSSLILSTISRGGNSEKFDFYC